MRNLFLKIVTLLIVAGTAAGCGGSEPGPGPGTSVLTTLELTPATATLFTVAPGNTVTLAAVARDQDGGTMAGIGSPSYSTDNGAVASVSQDGTITAVAAGTAAITGTLTAGDVTRTDVTTVTVQAAPTSAAVTTPGLAFQPAAVDVGAGGSVSWTFGPTTHNVSFETAGAPEDVPDLQNGSASRVFPTNGSFNYRCTIHPQMTGAVHVH